MVAINAEGRVVGEDHPRAKLTDADVELIRELHEEYEGYGYRKLAKMFDVSRWYIRDLCTYKRRNGIVVGHRAKCD